MEADPVALVLDVPQRVAHDRNKARPDRDFGPHVIRQQAQQLPRSLRGLEREGFRQVQVLRSLEEIETAVIERQPLWDDLKLEHGPFDLIGDVHGSHPGLIGEVTRLAVRLLKWMVRLSVRIKRARGGSYGL